MLISVNILHVLYYSLTSPAKFKAPLSLVSTTSDETCVESSLNNVFNCSIRKDIVEQDLKDQLVTFLLNSVLRDTSSSSCSSK